MLDLIKKTVLAGIGATVITKEKVEVLLNEYVEKGKLSAQDAKNLSERIVADGKHEFEQVKHDLSGRFQELLEKSKLATRDELTALEKRLATLEAKLHSHLEAHPDHGEKPAATHAKHEPHATHKTSKHD